MGISIKTNKMNQFLKTTFRNTISVKQFESRTGQTFCRACSGFKLFSEAMNQQQKSPLESNELRNHNIFFFNRLCAFIVHKAEEKFVAHVFHCEPSAGPLCKTIEAACKVSLIP